jgi:holo-[acyl-carrier protein] synthase
MEIFVGCDIEEISRFKSKENNRTFLNKIYTEKELEYSLNKSKTIQHLAVRFCAKEAVFKALSSAGIQKINYKDIEIINNENGAPFVNVANLDKKADIKISLSHCKTYAMAQAAVIIENILL